MKRILITAIFILLYTVQSHAQNDIEWSAELFAVEGTAEVRSAQTGQWIGAHGKEKLFKSDEVRVGPQSRVAIQFRSGYLIRLASNSHLTITDDSLTLSDGKLHYFNRSASTSPEIITPLVTAAIRGTELIAEVQKGESSISVLEGAVVAKNHFGEVSLRQNEAAKALPGKPPVKSLIVSPKDLVQWTISVPVLAETNTLHDLGVSKDPSDKNLASALHLIQRGAMDEADALLRALPENDLVISEKLLFALSGGKDSEATRLMQQLSHSTSASAAISRSYYLQTKGDLEGALRVMRDSVTRYPNRELIAARAAELMMFFGEINEAQKIVDRLCGLTCTEPELLTIKGFISLITEDSKKARAHFLEVINGTPTQSRAYLGLGLTQVKDNQLQSAQESIERAIALDPSVSLYRSYLGKLNYERDNVGGAYREYQEAIRLDPNDPTPYLYRAYTALSDNDPLGAIGDIETSIEKNNNRAVYRSRLLLDQDEASRSAALGRAFREAGFFDGARVEAIRSVIEDPTNYSAYRLLAESYDYIFGADTAISELRKAQLLAPAGINFLSPIGGLQNSLTSFDTLFDINQTRTGVGYTFDGRDDIHIPALSTVGKDGSTAWGLSAISALGDGLKHGSFLRDTLLAATVEEEINWDKKLVFQGNGRFISTRDLNSEAQDIDSTDGGGAVSYVQHFDASQVLIADVSAERGLDRVASPLTGRPVGFDLTVNGELSNEEADLVLNQLLHEQTNLYRGGLQYIYSGDPVSFIVGSQFLYQRPERHEESIIEEDSFGILDGLGAVIDTSSRSDLNAHDLYLYTTSRIPSDIRLTLGVVRTDIESDKREVPPFLDQTISDGRFNPKAGVTWEPYRNTLLRASYTESLRKSSLEDQLSLEPSFVAGIPQRFNDLTGTTARDAGLGINWKDPGFTYVGAEYIYRRVTEPFWSADEALALNFDTGEAGYTLDTFEGALSHRRQHFVREYISQRLTRSLALNLEHQRAEDDLAESGYSDDLTNDTVSLTLRWFHPTGFFAYTGPDWIHQKRKERFGFDDGVETAWIWNATIGYRLPKRQGRIFIQARNIFDRDFILDQSAGFSEYLKPEAAYIAGFEFNY